MATANLIKEQNQVSDGKDSIVIIEALADLPGGRTLDVSGVASGTTVVKAGHIIIQNDTTKVLSPLGITSNAYDSLPNGSSYLGVLKATVRVADPRAAIVLQGVVNAAASPYTVTRTIKSGLPLIKFLY